MGRKTVEDAWLERQEERNRSLGKGSKDGNQDYTRSDQTRSDQTRSEQARTGSGEKMAGQGNSGTIYLWSSYSRPERLTTSWNAGWN